MHSQNRLYSIPQQCKLCLITSLLHSPFLLRIPRVLSSYTFVSGKMLYLFDTYDLVQGYPKRLVDLGLPESLEKLDAAMVWGHNGKTYFYSGTMYWK